MTIDDLKAQLQALSQGKMACIHHDAYASLFPPGEPDEGARKACYGFAKALGCQVANRPTEQTICFIKNKGP